MMKGRYIEHLGHHALETLPDSLRARRELLESVRRALKRGSETRQRAAYLLKLIEEQDKVQAELPLWRIDLATD